MAKRLVVCCDGTWDKPDELSNGTPTPTNVTKVALALDHVDSNGQEQRVFYHRGVGTRLRDRVTGGAFGLGVSRAVRDTYAFLVDNYEPGDKLYFFGFSRGAFTARSAAGFVRNSGILRRENSDLIDRAYALYRRRGNTRHPTSIEATLFRRSYSYEPRVHFIGVWDTVGALGIPFTGSALIARLNWRTRFHDAELSSRVESAFQALAIDERRGPFCPTLWKNTSQGQRVEQVWFTGVHRDVGGGYSEHGLSDIALLWMMDRARECGLKFLAETSSASLELAAAALDNLDASPTDRAAIQAAILANPEQLAHAQNSCTGIYRCMPRHRRQPGNTDPVHEYAASTAVEQVNAFPDRATRGFRAYLDGPHQILDIKL